MKTIRVSAKAGGPSMLELSGPDLTEVDKKEIRRFTLLRIRTTGDEWLRFDLDAKSPDTPDLPSPRWRRESVAVFNDVKVESSGLHVVAEGDRLELKAHWTSPLTPEDSGLWLRIVVEAKKQRLIVRAASPTHGADRWRADEQEGVSLLGFHSLGKWEPVTFSDLNVSSDETPESWASDWAVGQAQPYSETAPGSGDGALACSLLERRDEGRWLVDLRKNDEARHFFAVGFLDAKQCTNKQAAFAAAISVPEKHLEHPRVNARALAEQDLPGAAVLRANTLDLRCARVIDGNERTLDEWLLEWTGVAGSGAVSPQPTTLSFSTLWVLLARHYPLGLAAAQSRQRLTAVPTELSVSGTLTLRFRVTRALTTLEVVTWQNDLDVTARLGGCTNDDGTAPELLGSMTQRDRLSLEDAVDTATPADALFNAEWMGAQGRLAPVISGVALSAQSFTSGSLVVRRRDGSAIYGQAPLAVDVEWAFGEASIEPASQDPEIGFEAASAWLNRERPIVVSLIPAEHRLRLSLAETANEEQSRLLRLTLFAEPGQNAQEIDIPIDAVVIDPSPLTIARVRASARVHAGEIVAEYTDDSDLPAEWSFRSEGGGMRVTLPPQTIGEEMIKGRLYLPKDGQTPAREVPLLPDNHQGPADPIKPFDFRLATPAELALDRTDIDTARAAAPWALRRLLSARLGAVGIKLDAATFELFYGLTTQVTGTDLRIADLDAFIGRIPLSDELRRSARERLPRETSKAEELRAKYGLDAQTAVRDLFYRPSWWPLFRSWTARGTLTIQDGVTFHLRPARQTADPFKPARFAIADLSVLSSSDQKRLPLRGGVDWPFQSQNVYDEFIRHGSSPPQGRGGVGTISGVAFGSLGGSGRQSAAFSNGKTLIITDTTQGRLNGVTLIRLGRIAMLWNHARHVIVYERTTRTAPRYRQQHQEQGIDDLDHQSQAFEGFAALRKVREYVEIMQPRRGYPDRPLDRPLAGPLVQSTFETTIIPVKASWGRDVNQGWVMPLRGALFADEAPFFPFPAIFLDLARAVDKGAGAVGHRVLEPGNLLFFSSTRDEDGGDTDEWPAWPDIDFPLVEPPPVPQLPFSPSIRGSRRQPDAVPADFGQRRFTVNVQPAEEAVNLMHGRGGTGIEAFVRSISLARGLERAKPVASSLATDLVPTVSENAASVNDALRELSDHLAKLAQQSPQTLIRDATALRADAQKLLTRVTAATNQISGKIATHEQALKDNTFSWEREQKAWNDRAKEKLNEATKRIADQLVLSGTIDTAKLRQTLDAVRLQANQALDEIGFLPDLALDRVSATISELKRRLESAILEALSAVRAAVAKASTRIAEGDPNDRRSIGVELVTAVQAEADRLATIGDDVAGWIQNTLGPWFSRAGADTNAFARLLAAANDLIGPQREQLTLWAEEIPPFDIEEPDFTALDDQLLDIIDRVEGAIDEALGEVMQWVSDLAQELKKLSPRTEIDKLRKTFNTLVNDLVDDLEKQGTQILERLEDIKKALGTWAGTNLGLDNALIELQKSALWKDAEGVFNEAKDLGGIVTSASKAIADALGSADLTLDELSQTIATETDRVLHNLEAAGTEIEQAMREQLRGLQALNPVALGQNAGLEITRALASGPINDTIRCTRDALGYYYRAGSDLLNLTRSSAIVNDLGPAALNALSMNVPIDRIRDRLLPQLDNIDVGKLLPDFGGLKLTDLLPELRVPPDATHEYGWMTVKHGFDKDRLSAWADVNIDKPFDGRTPLFRLPPLDLQLKEPYFEASSRMEVFSDGRREQRTRATLSADWELCLSEKPLVTLRDAALKFDGSGSFDFDFDTEDVVLAPELDFITKALSSLMPQEEGLTLTWLAPVGVRAELALPLPDLGTGAFTLTSITLYLYVDLLIEDGFEVRAGFWLSKPNRPFGLAVLFMGGGGWLGVEARYRPLDRFSTRVSIGLAAGAFAAVNFGVASGSVGVLFAVGVEFFRDWSTGQGTTALSLGIIVWGELSILGIASASLRLVLRIEYTSEGGMTGYGTLSVSIKICWCFTLNVNTTVTMPFKKAGGGKKSKSLKSPGAGLKALGAAASPTGAPARAAADDGFYGSAPKPAYLRAAIDLHFRCLDLS
jgi:hypothetical protein